MAMFFSTSYSVREGHVGSKCGETESSPHRS
jgi:hypothetical protein